MQRKSLMDVHFVDTTFRDGSQSLWASGMRTGMKLNSLATAETKP